MKTNLKFILSTLVMISLTTTASANTLNYKGISNPLKIDFLFNNQGFFIDIGKRVIELEGHYPVAMCIEIGPPAISGDITLESTSSYWSSHGNNGLYAAWLLDQYTPAFGFDYSTLTSQTITNINQINEELAYSALQIAIWDTIYNYDSSNNLHSGTVFEDGMANEKSQHGGLDEQLAWDVGEYYSQSLRTALSAPGTSITDLFSGRQIITVADFDPENNDHGGLSLGTAGYDKGQELLVARPIPEPATMLLFGLGLLGISAMGRKRS